MVVQHNLQAMNSNRMLNVNTQSQAKSTEKLSSGYKINRAADDAAGLAISEKMRRQIRGLTQASANAQDGISMVQTAEGALGEVHDMLQRINELAVKGENGTLTTQDRGYIASEVSQLMSEIDRVRSTTTFNEMNLLTGELSDGKGLQVGAESNQRIAVKVKDMQASKIFDDYANKAQNFYKNESSFYKTQANWGGLNESTKKALNEVSQQRSDLGAVQNRLEHTIKNLDNVVENTTSAESSIRDTDMATEMV
ncbi:MAG: flagellin, partial [Lachnospiraceae bacterium]|nr:flagellin [Lachnospiraceae bacterium]